MNEYPVIDLTPRHEMKINVTGWTKRHIDFFRLISNYDMSCIQVQENVLKALNNKHATPLDRKTESDPTGLEAVCDNIHNEQVIKDYLKEEAKK